MSRPTDTAALGLSHILTDLLPRTVNTPEAPDRYPVAAVFTRRPTPGEISALNGPSARAWLEQAGFPDVGITVSDRRLQITDTNLPELAAGLAASIAGFLAHVSTDDTTNAHVIADELEAQERREGNRSDVISALVDDIRLFSYSPVDDEPWLGLAHIVTALLPQTLGTESAPERYTVVADFTRKPTTTELAVIVGPLVRRRLDAGGYPVANLVARDRRLEIRDTNLAELAGGLAGLLAALLIEISHAAAAQVAEAAAEATRRAESELARVRSVEIEAAAISFSAPS